MDLFQPVAHADDEESLRRRLGVCPMCHAMGQWGVWDLYYHNEPQRELALVVHRTEGHYYSVGAAAIDHEAGQRPLHAHELAQWEAVLRWQRQRGVVSHA